MSDVYSSIVEKYDALVTTYCPGIHLAIHYLE